MHDKQFDQQFIILYIKNRLDLFSNHTFLGAIYEILLLVCNDLSNYHFKTKKYKICINTS